MNRRRFLHGGVAGALAAGFTRDASADALDLTWDRLIPDDARSIMERLLDAGREMAGVGSSDGMMGVVSHEAGVGMSGGLGFEAEAARLVEEFDGLTVRLPGYVVPLEFDGVGTRVFLLVPFVGACIHVPPPPPNQIVLIEADEPYPLRDYFDAVYVTGAFSRLQQETELAEVGYRILANRVEPYAAVR